MLFYSFSVLIFDFMMPSNKKMLLIKRKELLLQPGLEYLDGSSLEKDKNAVSTVNIDHPITSRPSSKPCIWTQ